MRPMQLRHYAMILRRFWLLIVALPLAVGLVSLAGELRQPQRYGTSARLIVTQQPLLEPSNSPAATLPDFNMQHSWLSSEFILDDLPQIVTSRLFAEDVSALLAQQGATIAPEVVQSGLRADNIHRAVTIASNADNPATAEALVRGAVATLQANGLKYWNRANGQSNGLSVAVLDPAGPAAPLHSNRQMLINVGMRSGLGLAAAVGIAFLLHYLDDTIRRREQVEQWVGVQVVGVIPRE